MDTLLELASGILASAIIPHRFPGQTLLIDVGFLHLPGDRGMLSLLEQEDYTA